MLGRAEDAEAEPAVGRLADGAADTGGAAFEKLGIPAEPINTLDEIMGHSQLDLRNMLLDIEYPPGSGNVVRTAGMPWRAVAAPGPPKSPPGLGEHTQDVLRELGLLQSAAQYDR